MCPKILRALTTQEELQEKSKTTIELESAEEHYWCETCGHPILSCTCPQLELEHDLWSRDIVIHELDQDVHMIEIMHPANITCAYCEKRDGDAAS